MRAMLTSLRFRWHKDQKSRDQEQEVVKLQGSAGGEKPSEEPFAPPDISDRAEYFKG